MATITLWISQKDMNKRLPNLKASDLARKTYGSFATAWEVMRNLNLPV
ncbi:MAG: hypothetical protein ACXVC3_12695 [Bdellovibrio sp.]